MTIMPFFVSASTIFLPVIASAAATMFYALFSFRTMSVITPVTMSVIPANAIVTTSVDLVSFAVGSTTVVVSSRMITNRSLNGPVTAVCVPDSVITMIVVRPVSTIIPHPYFITMVQVIISVSAGEVTPVNP